MTTTTRSVYYDPSDASIGADPYPLFRRMRDECPLYHNAERDFYALSRYTDVERALLDGETYSSARGVTLELINSGMRMPPGSVVFEDAPSHTIHRALLSRLFTPKKILALEPRIRDFTAASLDPHVGAGGFDFIEDIALEVPTRVLGMILGIPWDDQIAIRDRFMQAGQGVPASGETYGLMGANMFAEYVDWRASHPSDDVMTELMYAEFEDESGQRRRLRRQELLMYINVVVGAATETTRHLIGWTGKVLADHPAQRHELVQDMTLIPDAIEELLRFEPPSTQTCRYVARDAVHYGETVPAGSAIILLMGSANRDERRYADPDRFDIRRKPRHLSFGLGPHFCLGAHIARLEGRIVLEEVLRRWPEWEIDAKNASLAPSATSRGWARLPVTTA